MKTVYVWMYYYYSDTTLKGVFSSIQELQRKAKIINPNASVIVDPENIERYVFEGIPDHTIAAVEVDDISRAMNDLSEIKKYFRCVIDLNTGEILEEDERLVNGEPFDAHRSTKTRAYGKIKRRCYCGCSDVSADQAKKEAIKAYQAYTANKELNEARA